jgi:hypothetical protein
MTLELVGEEHDFEQLTDRQETKGREEFWDGEDEDGILSPYSYPSSQANCALRVQHWNEEDSHPRPFPTLTS